MVWRDVWDGTPNVVILSEMDAQGGVLEDTVLFLLYGPTDFVTVSNPEGQRWRVRLPDDLPDGSGMHPGLDLPVETPNEEPKTDPDHPLP